MVLRKTLILLILLVAGVMISFECLACTNFTIKAEDDTVVRGRSMEFAMDVDSDIIAVPRGYVLTGTLPNGGQGMQWKAKYGFVAANAFDVVAAIDGINEKGLTFAALYFAGFAEYQKFKPEERDMGLASWEFGAWVLSKFRNVDEVVKHINEVRIVPVIQEHLGIVVPLHYAVADATGRGIVIEPVGGRLKISDNRIGVLTNAPTFDWHMTNLRNYVTLRPEDAPAITLGDVALEGISKGSGMHGLPGDGTSPSRFVRAAFLKSWCLPPASGKEAVLQSIRLMNGFFIVKGDCYRVIENVPNYQITQWETFTDLTHRRYYYRTYDNMTIRVVDLTEIDFSSGPVKRYPMEEPMRFTDVTGKLK